MQVRVKPEHLAVLTDEDKAALHAIYRHRCLDENQLAKYLYNGLDDGVNAYTLDRLQILIETGFLKLHEYEDGRKHVFVLTNLGVQVVRDLSDKPLYVMRKNGKRRNYEATAGELLMPDKMLNHQTRLNTLSLEIIQRCGLDPGCYKDSKFASNFTYAQPDGVIELPDFDIFLEMDMGHERGEALRAKWEHYRTYFNSRDYYIRRNKPIIVLFAIEQVKWPIRRRTTVVQSLSRVIFDMVGPNLDFLIGSNEELYEVAERVILHQPNKQFQESLYLSKDSLGFRISRPKVVEEIWKEPIFYMRLSDKVGKPIVEDGRPQEFLLEDGLDRRISTLKNIAAFPQRQAELRRKTGRDVPLLVLVPGERAIKNDLIAAEALGVPDVYFTTPRRLRNRPLNKAIFQFDALVRRFHFADYAFHVPIYENLKGG